MHVPDGFLTAPASLATGVVAAAAVALALRGARRELDERTSPLAGLVAAFVFAVQMLNFPVAAGTSGHLLGGALAAVLVGPWTATLCLTVVLGVQALLFADRFGLSSGARGLLVASFGLAGLATGRAIGVLTERYGLLRVGLIALVVLGAAVAAVGVAPWVGLLVVLVAVAGVSGTAARILTNSLGITSTPANVGGATSVTMAAQFLGVSLVPSLLPLYDALSLIHI